MKYECENCGRMCEFHFSIDKPLLCNCGGDVKRIGESLVKIVVEKSPSP